MADLLVRPVLLLSTTWAMIAIGLFTLRSGEAIARPTGAAPRSAVAPAGRVTAREIRSLELEVHRLRSLNRRLQRRIRSFRPRGLHLVIDTGANHLYLLRGDKIIRDAIVSTGSGVTLADPDNPRSWVFDTPRGELRVRRKIRDPVWTKPDWAFIEVGEPLPRRWRNRIKPDVLGDYALDLGDGYLIHGTLFERALGLHVTHGCVRVGTADLRAIFRAVRIGTPVYIL